jgi:hypothetical protein
MSEKDKKATKAAEPAAPQTPVADQIIHELERVHMRIPKY